MRLRHFMPLLAITILFLGGCAPKKSTAVIASSSDFAAPMAPMAIPAPVRLQSLTTLTDEWTPAETGGSGADDLRAALSSRQTLMVVLGDQMTDQIWDDKVFQMVRATSESLKIVERKRGTVNKILLEKGEIPWRTTWEVAGTDLYGRPWTIPKEHPLKTDWGSKKKDLKGAQLILMMNFIDVDASKLNEMRRQKRGGCEKLEAQLDTYTADAQQIFAPLKAELNPALSEEFTRRMENTLSGWKQEVTERLAQESNTDAIRCLKLYRTLLGRYDPCTAGSCNLAPALYTGDASVIGMDMTASQLIPTTCRSLGIRDYVAELKDIGNRTTAAILPQLSNEWAGELLYLSMIETLSVGVKDLCSAGHRRYKSNELSALKTELAEYIASITQVPGTWRTATGQARIAGTGAVEVLAKPVQGGDAVSVQTTAILGKFRTAQKCADSKRRPVLVSLVDVETSEVVFSSIVFEEQIFCEDLPPGTP